MYFKVFDVTRKPTYKNLAIWYKELREYREDIPCILVANKIDGNSMSIPHLMKKKFPCWSNSFMLLCRCFARKAGPSLIAVH